jgi:hypothetical protein
MEEALWTRFGWHLEDVEEKWPVKKIQDYFHIFTIEAKVREQQDSESGAKQSASDTERAYQAMKMLQGQEKGAEDGVDQ